MPGSLLSELTTLRVGGPAGKIVRVDSRDALTSTLESIPRGAASLLLLGGGSNVVLSDEGFGGTVLLLEGGAIESNDGGSSVEYTVDAGAVWDDFVAHTVAAGGSGLELMSGIPGLVGAAPIQNIGAYGQQVCDVLTSVEVVDRSTLEVREIAADECGFAFRSSHFKTDWLDRFVISRVRFSIPCDEPVAPSTYVDIEKYFEREGGSPTDVPTRRTAVLKTRATKSMVLDDTDPNARSVGSFFVNPTVPTALALELAEQFRTIGLRVHYLEGNRAPSTTVQRIPAAHLLRACGFNPGDRFGPVKLSDNHVLAIVTTDGATATDVWMVANHIREAVRARTGVSLEYEPRFLGAFPAFDPEQFGRNYAYEPGSGTEPDWLRSYR